MLRLEHLAVVILACCTFTIVIATGAHRRSGNVMHQRTMKRPPRAPAACARSRHERHGAARGTSHTPAPVRRARLP
eukprot:CAMPEP_0185191838 /NCGR_PEP_ID=MMETSP1140-20130426/17295_1 /TAXON_ID=298111 /ORGANISM="Pavlova sp., Strain CCMP459" /LENGTH=75 /DNA_ID=CAMNT_0027758563 /DNA_START=343 /DNA_END=570 /DNA_ORIENTATION=-